MDDKSIDNLFEEISDDNNFDRYYGLAKLRNPDANEDRLKACASYCSEIVEHFPTIPLIMPIAAKIIGTAVIYCVVNQFELSLAMEEKVREVMSGNDEDEKVSYLNASKVLNSMHNYKNPGDF